MKKQLTWLGSSSLIVVLTLGLTFRPIVSATVPGTNTLVSVNNSGNGQGGNNNSFYSPSQPNDVAISADGSSVVFVSNASNLVSSDTNGVADLFVRNLTSGTTTRVDVSSTGVEANAAISSSIYGGALSVISRTGRYIAFVSAATNLIDGQTTAAGQTYIHDMQTGTTSLVSQTSTGIVANYQTDNVFGVSSDGRFVLFESGANNLGATVNSSDDHLYRADLSNYSFQALNNPIPGSTYHANALSASMSCDGSLVVDGEFQDQLTSADTNTYEDVYLVDLRNGQSITDLSAAATKPTLQANISCNGDYITFHSGASEYTPAIVPSGNYLNHGYVYNRVTGNYTLIDQTSSGTLGNHDVGGYIGVDDNGNTVFSSNSTNLQTGYALTNQVWLHNYASGTAEILSKNSSGAAGNSASSNATLSSNGKMAAYYSGASNLISSDTNGYVDIFSSLTGL